MPGRSGDWWLVTSHSQLLIPNPLLQTFSGGFAAKKEANPASLRSAAPSKGRGSRGHSLLPMEGGAPKGRRLDGESGMKKSGGDRLKSTIYESTLSTADAVPLPRWGRQRGGGFAAKKKANPASLRSVAPSKGRGLRGYTLLPMEGGAPKGRRLDGKSGMKDQRGDRFSCAVCGSTRIPHSSFFPGIVQSAGKRNLPGASLGL